NRVAGRGRALRRGRPRDGTRSGRTVASTWLGLAAPGPERWDDPVEVALVPLDVDDGASHLIVGARDEGERTEAFLGRSLDRPRLLAPLGDRKGDSLVKLLGRIEVLE